MTPVKDQGSCGSCWAFAGHSTLETILSIKSGNPPVRLSEQEQVDCAGNRAIEIFGKDYGNRGCMGGLEYYSWNFISDHGTMPDEVYPYTGTDDTCTRTRDDSRLTV